MNSQISEAVPLSVKTSASLLMRAKDRDETAWRQLADLYTPMVYRWTRKAGIQANDAQDVVQDVFLTVALAIDNFRRSRPGDSFRGWLWTISRHKILDHCREKRRQALASGEIVAQQSQQFALPESDEDEERSEMCRLRHRAIAMLRELFEPQDWEAFLRTVVHGDHPTNVAKDLGISVATVYRAKFRVLARLRTELEGL